MRAATAGANGETTPKQISGSAVTTASAAVLSEYSSPSSPMTGPTAANGPRKQNAAMTSTAAGASSRRAARGRSVVVTPSIMRRGARHPAGGSGVSRC
jgi:hypothetical protein